MARAFLHCSVKGFGSKEATKDDLYHVLRRQVEIMKTFGFIEASTKKGGSNSLCKQVPNLPGETRPHYHKMMVSQGL